MKNLLVFLSVWLALPLAAQTVNPNQIRPATVDGQVLTTPIANQAPSWQTPASGVSIATTPPCTVNGGTGPVSSGTATITCANGTQTYYKQQGTGTYFQLIRPTGCVATHTSGFSAECVGNNAGSIFTDGTGEATLTYSFTGVTPPAGATLVGAYAYGISSATGNTNAGEGFGTVGVGTTCTSGNLIPTNAGTNFAWPTGQGGCQLSTTSGLDTVQIEINMIVSATSVGGSASVDDVGIEVDYNVGPTPPASASLLVAPPLSLNNNVLGMGPIWPTATYPTTIARLSQYAYTWAGTIVPVTDAVNSTDCATGGGSTLVDCVSDGAGGWTARSFTGGITALTGDVSATGPGSAAATVLKVNNGTIPTSQTCVGTNSSGQFIDGSCTPANGVQYNPTTTNYIFLSFSGLYDDNHALSSAVPVTSASCVGASAPYTCTVVTTSAHNLSVGSYVDVATITGWLSSGVTTPFNGSFQIISAGFTTTQFEFLSSLGPTTCSSSCGNVYDASYWGIYQTANQPFLKGHGTVYGDESDVATADTNFSTALAPLCNLSPGPNYLIIQAGQNDLDAGATFATIAAHLQSIWAKAHTAGCKVIQGSIVPAKYGSDLTNALIVNNAYLNEWLPTQAQSFANIASGQYYDQFVDYNAYMSYTSAGGALGTLGTAAWQAKTFAQITNQAFANQGGNIMGPPPFFLLGGSGYTWDLAGNAWSFINSYGDSSGNQWMIWDGDVHLYDRNYNGSAPLLQMTAPSLGTGTDFCSEANGNNLGTNNAYLTCFNYVSSTSTSNYYHMRPYAGSSTDAIRMYGDSTVSIPTIATSPSTSPICPNGTNGTLTTSGCSGSGGSAPSATFSIATGAAASPAAPYVLAPASGTVSDCYWTTLTSDGSTNLVFNVKFNGTNILSGTSATVTAGDTPGSSHTFSLTSSTITITQGQKWELDISTGAADWTGAVQCY